MNKNYHAPILSISKLQDFESRFAHGSAHRLTRNEQFATVKTALQVAKILKRILHGVELSAVESLELDAFNRKLVFNEPMQPAHCVTLQYSRE